MSEKGIENKTVRQVETELCSQIEILFSQFKKGLINTINCPITFNSVKAENFNRLLELAEYELKRHASKRTCEQAADKFLNNLKCLEKTGKSTE